MRHRTSSTRHALQPCVVAGLFLLAAACGGEKKGAASDTGAAAAPAGSTAAAAPAGSTSAAGAPAAATPGSTAAGGGAGTAASAKDITPKMVALGDSIFHGQAAGGLCYTCHGADAKGTQLAPPLKKGPNEKWLTGDGSYGFLVQRVTQGMPNPTPPYTAPMPPMGGAQLTQQQIHAVAAYVYSLNHKVG